MTDHLYTEYPELYDAIQREWDYDRDVAFVCDAVEPDSSTTELLEVGCGTGEHTRRFVDAGFDVTAIDPAEGMLDRAREKCRDADFRTAALPEFDFDDQFDAIVAIRGVINHLPPESLDPAARTLAAHLADGGVLIFDNAPLPPDGNDPALDTADTEYGRYARVAQMQSRPDDRLDWVSVTFTGEGAVVTTRRPMTPFAEERIAASLDAHGFGVETHDGYDPRDDRTVFAARK